MRLTHRFRVPAPVEVAYAALSRLERVAPCFPGATAEPAGGDRFTGSLAVKLGPVPLVYVGTGTYLERDPDRHRVVVEARGEDRRGLGSAVAQLTTRLTGRGDHTEVEVVTELELTGKPARYGPGVVQEVADRLVDQFTSCLVAQVADGGVGRGGDEEVPAAGGLGDRPAPGDAALRHGPVFSPGPPSTVHAGGRGTPSLLTSRPATALRRFGPVLLGLVVVAVVTVRLVGRPAGGRTLS